MGGRSSKSSNPRNSSEAYTLLKLVLSQCEDLCRLAIENEDAAKNTGALKAILDYEENITKIVQLHKNLVFYFENVLKHISNLKYGAESPTMLFLVGRLSDLGSLIETQCELVKHIQEFVLSIPNAGDEKFRKLLNLKVGLKLS